MIDSAYQMQLKALSKSLKEESKKLGKPLINSIPHTCNTGLSADALCSIPQYQFPNHPYFRGYTELLQIHGGVLQMMPNVWQLTYPYYLLARESKLYIARGSIHNVPIAVEMLIQAKIQTIWTYPEAIGPLCAELEKRGAQHIVETIILMRGIEPLSTSTAEACNQIPTHITVVAELHLFPGHIIGYQTLPLFGTLDQFHLDGRYQWEHTQNGSVCTAVDPTVLPLNEFQLPGIFTPADSDSTQDSFLYTAYEY